MWTQRTIPVAGITGLGLSMLLVVGCTRAQQQGPPLVVPYSPLINTRKLCRRLQAKLPEGWKITSVTESEAPKGWARLAGQAGLRLYMENPTATVVHPILGPYHPSFTIWLMPLAWEGSEPTRNQRVRNGEYGQGPFKPDPDPESVPAAYWGTTPPFHYFYTNVGMGPWRKAPVITAKLLAVAHWEPPPAKADRAAPTDTGAPEQDHKP